MEIIAIIIVAIMVWRQIVCNSGRSMLAEASRDILIEFAEIKPDVCFENETPWPEQR
jgi:hypothetical protein